MDILRNAVDLGTQPELKNNLELLRQVGWTSCVEVPTLGVTADHLAAQLQAKNRAFFSNEYFSLLFRPDELVELFSLHGQQQLDDPIDHEKINSFSRFLGELDASTKQTIAAAIPKAIVDSDSRDPLRQLFGRQLRRLQTGRATQAEQETCRRDDRGEAAIAAVSDGKPEKTALQVPGDPAFARVAVGRCALHGNPRVARLLPQAARARPRPGDSDGSPGLTRRSTWTRWTQTDCCG